MDETMMVKFEELRDTRKYVLLATLGEGKCPLCEPYGGSLCKQTYENKDHEHACAVRYGYEGASEWALRKRNQGWSVKVMDRVDQMD